MFTIVNLKTSMFKENVNFAEFFFVLLKVDFISKHFLSSLMGV